jgi:hypothetical protein
VRLPQANIYPGCQEFGERVQTIPLQSLLRDEPKECIQETTYRFCASATR